MTLIHNLDSHRKQYATFICTAHMKQTLVSKIQFIKYLYVPWLGKDLGEKKDLGGGGGGRGQGVMMT